MNGFPKGATVGKTPKPLKILVADSLLPWPELEEMAEQGHQVDVMEAPIGNFAIDVTQYDIILSPNAHFMVEEMKKYLPVAVKAARGRKYAKTKVSGKGTS